MDVINESVLCTLKELTCASDRNKLCQVLLCTKELQSFGIKKPSAVNEEIGQINALLNIRKDRLPGLLLLQQCLKQCSSEIFMRNAVGWAQELTNIIKTLDGGLVLQLCSDILSSLLSYAASMPELSRELASSVIPVLVPALMAVPRPWLCYGLTSLACCMKHFAGPCGPFMGKIEQFLVSVLNSSEEICKKEVCRCLSLLPGCGGSGLHGAKHADNWALLCDKLLASLHDTLDTLYADYETYMESYSCPDVKLNMSSVTSEEPSRTLCLTARFSSLSQGLNALLSQDFSTPVQVPVEDILDLLCRALYMTPKPLLMRATRERVLLASVLPFIHTQALKITSVLIVSCGSSLVPYTDIVCRLLTQTLAWSAVAEEATAYGHHRPYSMLRSQVYTTLATLLQTLGASANVEDVASDFFKHMARDVKPQTDVVKVLSKATKNLQGVQMTSGKKKRKHSGVLRGNVSDEAGQMIGQRKVDATANQQVVSSALQALQCLLLTHGPLLEVSIHKGVQQLVIPMLLTVSTQPGCAPIPYSQANCRLALYGVLAACVLSSHHMYAAPIQSAVCLLQRGTLDPDTQVSSLCKEKLIMCESILHPRVPAYSIVSSPIEPELEVEEEMDFLAARNQHVVMDEYSADVVENTSRLTKKRKLSDEEEGSMQKEESSVDSSSEPGISGVAHPKETIPMETIESGSSDEEAPVVEINQGESGEGRGAQSKVIDIIITGEKTVSPGKSSEEHEVDIVKSITENSEEKDIVMDSLAKNSEEAVASQPNSTEPDAQPTSSKTVIGKDEGPDLEEMLKSFVDVDPDSG